MTSRRSNFVILILSIALLGSLVSMGLLLRQNEQLTDSHEDALRRLSLLQAEQATNRELIARLRVERVSKESMQTQAAHVRVPSAESSSDGVLEMVGQLKRYAQLHPEFTLPEFALLKDTDWLAVAKGVAEDTEGAERLAIGLLRQNAKQKFLPQLREAETAYKATHGGRGPADPRELKAFLADKGLSPVLDRYVASTPGERRDFDEFYFKESTMVDPLVDTRLYIGADTSIGMVAVGAMADALAAFKRERGSNAKLATELAPYLPKDVDLRLVEEMIQVWERPRR